MKNVTRVVDNDALTTVVVDPVMADAVADAVDAAEKKTKVFDELEKAGECVVSERDEEEETPLDNIYTKPVKITLEEDLEEPAAHTRVSTTTDEDYLDFDMFDFVYGLVADTDPRPKNPLGRRYRKFAYAGSDDYIHANSHTGVPQVGTEESDKITVYADSVEDFQDIKQICDMYGLTYSGPNPKKSEESRWAYSFTIDVPMIAEDTPMSIEEYFEPRGLTLEDVMGTAFARGKESRIAKLNNESDVKATYDKWVRIAATNEGPLTDFIKKMFDEMNGLGLTFHKGSLTRKFLKEFEDDFED